MISIIYAFTTTAPVVTADDSNNTTGNNTINARRQPYDDGYGYGYGYEHRYEAEYARPVSCFSSDTLVTLINQQKIPIGKRRVGDQLLTLSGTKIVSTEMMMMLDQNQLSSAMFYTIITASGHRVSLTSLHLIAAITYDGHIAYIPAKNIKNGDTLRVVTNGRVYSSSVIDIIKEIKFGYYAPLSITGTLLANNVEVSCFSNVKNHDIVQFYMSPLRWYYRLSRLLSIEQPFGNHTVNGIHYVAYLLHKIAQFVYPSIIQLS
ncbi:unnamed protein product [Rotaria magnacalcarata]|nr:unnamed protein product [Rotaria magnacalcarata]